MMPGTRPGAGSSDILICDDLLLLLVLVLLLVLLLLLLLLLLHLLVLVLLLLLLLLPLADCSHCVFEQTSSLLLRGRT